MTNDSSSVHNQSPALGGYVNSLLAARHDVACGGKASNLGRMIELGIPVPNGWVITDRAFQEFLDHNHLRDPIASSLDGIKPNQTSEIDAASRFITEQITAATIPPAIVDAINEWLLQRTVGVLFAVRSSAIGEDSQHAAFAGQLDSFLNLATSDDVFAAVKKCWASYWSQRSLFYQLSRGIPLRGMGVVIQEMVKSQISGILFTRNPESTNPGDSELIAEYCFGLGDELAAGRMNPGRFFISRTDFQWRQVAKPDQTSSTSEALLFNEQQITRLARASLMLETEFGCPQDIEWTIDNRGELFLVQSRPITTNTTYSIESPVFWSNANVNENFPDPISPFLYSIASVGYYHYFRNLGLALGIDPSRAVAMEPRLRNVIGVHGARMYYNLTNIHALLRMAPCGELLSQWFNSFVGAGQTPASDEASEWRSMRRSRFARMREALRIVRKTTWQYLFLSKRIKAFEQTIDAFAAATNPELLDQKSLSQLHDDLTSFMDIRCYRWTNASLADTAAMVSYGVLKRLLNHEFPDQDQAGLHNSLLKGVGDVVSGAPITELWNLSRMVRADAELHQLFVSSDRTAVLAEIHDRPQFSQFRIAFELFLGNWGFRCSGELMLTIPSFQERPEDLLELLQAYVDRDGESPGEMLQRQTSDRVSETAQVLAELRKRKLLWRIPWPTKATFAAKMLKICHHSIGLRERVRLKQALLYSRCRRIALAVANQLLAQGVLDDRNDIFFFTFEELDSLLAGGAMFPYQTQELIQLRNRGHKQLSQMNPADAFVLQSGTYLDQAYSQTSERNDADPNSATNELTGVGACGGQVTARAAILTDVSEFRLLSEGDVLVTRQTDPGWGPVFFLIKGLVMERGGMLSHGAILAREYGIPTVVGIRDATTRIATGQTVHVNGDRGVVRAGDE